MKKSPSDQKHYQLHQLNNGVKLLHVEDKSSSSCAIAIKLNTGSFSDPENCPGLAHLLEHCLFTGSRRYPQDNSLTHFLDAHQGQLNAWTASESSAWYFKVHAPYFAEALDIFFDMLLEPLFSLSGIEKELNAIDSEFKNKITEEQRRILDVQKQTVNPNHPFSRFSVGNNAIFKKFSHTELQSLLREFWQTNFVAGNISVCVSTPKNDVDCIDYIIAHLLKFKARPLQSTLLPELYQTAQLSQHIKVHTKRLHRRLVIIFNLNSDTSNSEILDYRLKNDALLSHLFGYEGQNSLLNFWKSRHWATQVIAGIGLSGSSFSDFNLYVELTETGLDKVNEITQSVLYFAQLIKSSSDLKTHYEEKARLNQLAFEHQQAQSSLDTVLNLVKNLSQFPVDEVLTAEYEMQGYDEEAMHKLLENIRPDKLRLISIASSYDIKKMQGGTKTPWYQVPYAVSDIDLPEAEEGFLKELQNSLKLPPENSYIPKDTTSIEKVQEHPKRYETKKNKIDGVKIWTGSNTVSSEAKGECFLSWSQTAGCHTLESVAQRKLFCSVMESKFNELFYPAQLAGIHYSFYSHQNGVGLHTSGFAQKQLTLCRDIIERLHSKPGECRDFELHKQEYLNTLLSSIRNKPLNRLFTALQSLCVNASWLPEDLAKIAVNATQPDIQQVHESLFKDYQLEGLVYGHWNKHTLQEFAVDIETIERTSVAQPKRKDTILLSQSEFRSLHFPCNHSDAALVVYLQSPAKSLIQQAKTMLAETLLAGFYFNWMRNQKQLGYQVGTGYMPFNEHPGIAMFVQSSTASPITLYQETKACMAGFYQWLASLSEQQWQNYHQSLIRQLGGNQVNFAVRCQRYWSAIGRQPVDFEFELHLQQAVSEIERNTLADWFKRHFLDVDADFTLYTAGDEDLGDRDFDNPLPSIYQFKA